MPLNIAVFSDSYRPYASGVVRSIDLFTKQLVEQGHHVYIFAPQYHSKGGQELEDTKEGPATKVFRFYSVAAPRLKSFRLPVPVSPVIFRVINALDIDVVHSHTPFLMGSLADGVSKRCNIPLVFTHHTMYHEYAHYWPGATSLLRKIIINWLAHYCEKCDLVVTPTQSVKDVIMPLYGLTKEPVVIPTGIELAPFAKGDRRKLRQEFGIGPEELVLVYVGRIAEEKSPGFLLDVLVRLRKRFPVRLVYVGDGPLLNYLKYRAQELGLEGTVLFTGHRSFDEVVNAFLGGDIFVFPSRTETQGLVTLEAMAAGLPVVGINAPGTRDLVTHNVEGFLTDYSVEEFTEAVARLIADPQLRAEFSRNALRKAQRLSSAETTNMLVDQYQRLVKNKQLVHGRT